MIVLMMFSLELFNEQKACFQLVMSSDYRTGRSYVMFNYNSIGWQTYKTSAHGYRVWTSYKRLYTSYSSLSYQLPSLIGNTGKDNDAAAEVLCYHENILSTKSISVGAIIVL